MEAHMASTPGSFGISALRQVFNDSSTNTRTRVIGIYTFLIAFNLLVWILALISFSPYPALLGTAVLAYSFGLRHAVDADHISAIDNVTRKLMQENKRPVAVGFFFSLGHSTIVVSLCIGLAIAAAFVNKELPVWQDIGGLIGTIVSATFLYIIAGINLLVLWEIVRMFRRVRRGEHYSEQTLDEFLNERGLMGRFFRPLLRMTNSSWKMYPIGVLFGLGFDTATEVGILAISATSATKGLPIYTILLFPALFMAGMMLLDTTDSILMLGAYGWAFVKPIRKLYYNLNITLISVLVAFIIGTIEVLSIVSDKAGLHGGIWDAIGILDLNTIGFIIVGIFLLSWAISTIIYKLKRYDDLEVPTAPQSTPDVIMSETGKG
jgi:high-affinity nickel-transport protein